MLSEFELVEKPPITDKEFAQQCSFASGEELAHTTPYKLAQASTTPETITVLDSDGVTRTYNVQQIETENPAIAGYILTGIETDNANVHISFRGTTDYNSKDRDIEGLNPGSKSFHIEKADILTQVNTAIKQRATEISQPINLKIAGHSLGGGDAQRMTTVILQAMSQNACDAKIAETITGNPNSQKNKLNAKLQQRKAGIKKKEIITPESRDGFTNVNSVEIFVANSVGVSKKTAKQCAKAAEYLQDPTHTERNITLKSNTLLVGGDGIQQTGQTNILADLDSITTQSTMMKIDVGTEGSWLGTGAAHTSKHFDKSAFPKHELYSNNTPEGCKAIEKRATRKSAFLQSYLATGVRKALHSITNLFTSKRKKKKDQDAANSSSNKVTGQEEATSAVALPATSALFTPAADAGVSTASCSYTASAEAPLQDSANVPRALTIHV